jgi:DNA-binding MarR family transcriptional regulator
VPVRPISGGLRSVPPDPISVNVTNPAATQARLGGRSPLFLREEELTRRMELVFFALRDLQAQTEPLLEAEGLARLHHGVLHFVQVREGLTVATLQSLLRTSKQSLSRALKLLMEKGLLRQTPGRTDRRQRLLALTPEGEALARRLDDLLRQRLAAAFRTAGPEAVAGFERVLSGLIDEGAGALPESLP